MSEDIVERLRSWRHDSWPADPSHEAAAEIERLRERVAVLENLAAESLNALTFDQNGPHRNALRAALEAKP